MDEVQSSHQRKRSEMLTIIISWQIKCKPNITYTALTFNAVVYHAPQFKCAYYHFPAFCCPAQIFAARLWGFLPLGSLLTGITCQLAELVLGFEVQCMEGHPFGAADFPLDPYLIPSTCCCGLDWNLCPTSKSSSLSACGNTSIHWSKLIVLRQVVHFISLCCSDQ